ncbi:NIPSNAP family protein [Catenulispora sp. NF23]|uniref:NIPSNAP family protein n=1 Tax=Catenulispora pinistramenti TaxID=2705254 RepID=A0ABS5KVW3_9ACTN|nr:NIPSNAP family protein [Catenulispora pinistramenti]MBS2534932.1 NIPSNAP family protein [Catenulispora pinistramenti]MBS2550205.1 NIPSNAP family protein [Catenulispora pinistramenti]
MFYEIRRYQSHPGRRDEWVRYMEDVVIPFQQSKGMTVTASFIDEQDADGYVWIRRFENEAEREALYAAVYDSQEWKNDVGPPVYEMLIAEKSVVTRAVPTPASSLR